MFKIKTMISFFMRTKMKNEIFSNGGRVLKLVSLSTHLKIQEKSHRTYKSIKLKWFF